MKKQHLRNIFEKPPVLTIDEVKADTKYTQYLATESYGMGARAVQRDADYKYMIDRLHAVLPNLKSGLW